VDAKQVPAGTIVVGIDGSPSSAAALAWATEQAALEHRQLTLVHTVQPVTFPSAGATVGGTGPGWARIVDAAREGARAVLSGATTTALDRHPQLTVNVVLQHSDPRSTLLSLGETAAMVVIGSRGRGPVASLLLGSVSVSVSKHAACPVVVHRPGPAGGPRSGILVGADGSERSLPAIDFAFRVASWRSLTLTVLHCYWESTPLAPAMAETDGSAEALVAESLAGMREKYPEVEVQVRLARGFADQHLIAASNDHDLVVVGHHPISVLNDIVYGSVAPQVVEHAAGAVAVVPSPALVVSTEQG